ncbi:hypothetical protein HYH03_017836 [Edaphochlamys debaryana]|uniref:Uncharacterized protein n=1 Tax=Edaphochlamys debaryana TaxID=47281 RepID=A0A835XNF0_9CHLO|nr:hypothetical protein HYH03_017836 [Edaphochlamys debaryana]|eukprot:KAG2483289.1 hypothetical protein HYH03_017836 [Edaphochlamys debaryana]
MEFNEKAFARQKFRSSRGRGRGGHRGGGRGGAQRGPAREAPSSDLDSNAFRFEDGSEALEDGVVAPRSQGADLEELLADADVQFSQVFYRFRAALQDATQDAPPLGATQPDQLLALDLDALGASLAALPLHTLLGLEPEYLEGLEPAPAKPAAARPVAAPTPVTAAAAQPPARPVTMLTPAPVGAAAAAVATAPAPVARMPYMPVPASAPAASAGGVAVPPAAAAAASSAAGGVDGVDEDLAALLGVSAPSTQRPLPAAAAIASPPGLPPALAAAMGASLHRGKPAFPVQPLAAATSGPGAAAASGPLVAAPGPGLGPGSSGAPAASSGPGVVRLAQAAVASLPGRPAAGPGILQPSLAAAPKAVAGLPGVGGAAGTGAGLAANPAMKARVAGALGTVTKPVVPAGGSAGGGGGGAEVDDELRALLGLPPAASAAPGTSTGAAGTRPTVAPAASKPSLAGKPGGVGSVATLPARAGLPPAQPQPPGQQPAKGPAQSLDDWLGGM